MSSTEHIYPVLITRDAAASIEQTLSSLREFPEVVVYDNGSADGTIELCKAFPNVRVEVGEFFGFGRTKDHAASLAKGDWLLSIDADEYLSEELLTTLRTVDLSDPTVAYAIKRHNLFMGREVKRAGWGNNWLVRLFNRRYCGFADVPVHERVVVPESCAIQRINGPLWHQAVTDLDQLLQKIRRHSEINRRRPGSRAVKLPNILLRTHWAFFRSYVLQRGFLDGWRGLVVAQCDATGTFFKHMKRHADHAIEAEKRASSSG